MRGAVCSGPTIRLALPTRPGWMDVRSRLGMGSLLGFGRGQYQASIRPVSGQYREPVSGASIARIGQDRPGSARIGPPLNQRAAIAPWGPRAPPAETAAGT